MNFFLLYSYTNNIYLFILNIILRIVEKNPGKFKIDNKELSSRRGFIEQTREEVKVINNKYTLQNLYNHCIYYINNTFQTMKDKMSLSRGRDRDRAARQVIN